MSKARAALSIAGALASVAALAALLRKQDSEPAIDASAASPIDASAASPPLSKPHRGIPSMQALFDAPGYRIGRLSARDGGALEAAFSGGTAEEYPAPYDWQTAEKVFGWLVGAMGEAGPSAAAPRDEIARRFSALRISDMPGKARVLGALWGIAATGIGYNLTWWWYHPATKQKQAQLAAVCAWIGMFFLGPETATIGSFGGTPVPHYGWDPPRRLSAAWLTRDPADQRRALMYLHEKIHAIACDAHPGTPFYCDQQRAWDGELAELQIGYPLGNDATAEAGNLRLVGMLARHVIIMNEASIQAPDVDAMVTGLIINIAAVVIGGIVAAVAPEAAPAAVKLAQGLSQAAAGASSSGGKVQAAIGAGVSYGLVESGVVDEIPGAVFAGAIAKAAAT